MKVVLITGSEIRHDYVSRRIALEPGLILLRTFFCGDGTGKIELMAQSLTDDDEVAREHLKSRKQIEKDMFESFIRFSNGASDRVRVPETAPNDPKIVDEIIELNPDIILVYGSCIIREPMLTAFSGRIVNAHLGLSPYYRGAATNFWPFVNGKPEFIGCTFMYLDSGIDTGEIIHQIRPHMDVHDGPHQIGNRLIQEMSEVYVNIALNFHRLDHMPQPVNQPSHVYRNSDYTPEAVKQAYENFNNGMIRKYLLKRKQRDSQVPIVVQPIFDRDKP